MKYLEHRRHALRDKPFAHINQRGVEKSRKIGNSLLDSNIVYVLTSNQPRAIETAVAMGFGVNETNSLLTTIPDVNDTVFPYEGGFLEIGNWLAGESIAIQKVKIYMDNLREFLLAKLSVIKDNEKLLVVSHGGIVEISVFALCQDFPFKDWNFSVDKSDGVLLSFKNNLCVKVEAC